MVLLVNQHTVPVFTDVVNAFADTGSKTLLFTGCIERGARPLSSSVLLKKSKAYNRKSTLTRFFSWLAFSVHYSFYLLTCRRPDLILVSTNPPLAPVITSYISRLRKIPYQILLYDLYPEALFQAGLVQESSIITKAWRWLNMGVFKHADKIFTLSESMKKAASRYVTYPERLRVIYNWADTSYVHPVAKNENPFVKRFELDRKFVVLYAGNMGLTHDLESLLEAAFILKDVPDVQFVLIGDGGKRKKLEKLSAEKQLKNVLFLPYQDEMDFPFAMASADIGVVTLGSGAEGISVPSKTYVNLAAGACLLSIAPKNSELNRLIQEHDVGVICEPGNAQQVARAIRLLVATPRQLQYYKSRSREAAAFFTPQNAYLYVSESHVSSAVIL